VESGGRKTSESGVPSTLEEAYGLRGASATSEQRDYYQEHVYRLRGEEYRSRGIWFDESARRRERRRAEAFRAVAKMLAALGGRGYSGGGSEKQSEK
jgi:hypothetical protein